MRDEAHQVVGLRSGDRGGACVGSVGVAGVLGGQDGALLRSRRGRSGLRSAHHLNGLTGYDVTGQNAEPLSGKLIPT